MRKYLFYKIVFCSLALSIICSCAYGPSSNTISKNESINESIVVDGVEQQVKLLGVLDGYGIDGTVFDEWKQTMSKRPEKMEFETSQEFEKRRLVAVKEINFKKNKLKNQVYRFLFTYSNESFFAYGDRTFSLKEYDLERGVFPISINSSEWKHRYDWNNDSGSLFTIDKYPIVFEGMPENIAVPIDMARKIRKEEKARLEVNCRITSCWEEERDRPKSYGYGTVRVTKFTMEVRVLSVRLHY